MQSDEPSPSRNRAALVALGLLFAFTLVALAELFSRWTADESNRLTHLRFTEQSLNRLAPCVLTEVRDGETWIVSDPVLAERPFALPLRRTEGIARIALVGESTGGMFGYELAELLRANPELAARVELIDCAVAGSGLEHVERRANEVLAYEPDAVVIVAGHNLDMLYPLDAARLNLLRYAYRSALVTELAKLWREPAGPSSTNYDQRVDALTGCIRTLARRTRERDVGLVLTTVASNHLVPPDAPAGLAVDPRFLEARLLYSRGRRAAAIERVARLASSTDQAYWHYITGVWQSREGLSDAATVSLRKAMDGPQDPRDRASSVVNRSLREIAREEGLVLFDSESVTAEESEIGVPGWDVMRDHCHLLPRLFRRQSPLLLAAALEAAGIPAEARVHVEPLVARDAHPLAHILEGAAAAQLAHTGDRSDRWLELTAHAVEHHVDRDGDTATAAVRAYVAGASFEAIADPAQRARILVALADGCWYGGQREQALELNAQAREYRSERPWIQLALFDLERGDEEAAARAIERAADLAPDSAEVLFYRTHLPD